MVTYLIIGFKFLQVNGHLNSLVVRKAIAYNCVHLPKLTGMLYGMMVCHHRIAMNG